MPTDWTPSPLRPAAGTAVHETGIAADSALDMFGEELAEVPPVHPAELASHHVTAVLVAHDGQRWLPRTIQAIATLDRLPDRIVAVDTGSRDGTATLLDQALGSHSVVSLPASTGFGTAVQAGLDLADEREPVGWSHRVEWVWLLHDDCAPAPDALRRLLECAVRQPGASVIGPKVRDWREDRQLLEVGLSMTGGGRRQTGLERREYDQGQHDATRDVLAVGSAGMLVRRDVWDELGGFDPRLTLFRDDLDFGWRANLAGHRVVVHPDAVIHHAEAAAHGRRRIGAARGRTHLMDRRNALYVLLANASAALLPLVYLRVLFGGLARSAGFLLGKQPALAGEELLAVLGVLLRPDRVFAARRRRARLRRVKPADLRPLFPPPGQQLRNASETVLSVVTGTGTGYDLPERRRAVATLSEHDDVGAQQWSVKLLLRPVVVLAAALLVLTLIAARGLIGAGRLAGGALLPAPDSAAALWATYTESWHGVGLGSPTPAPPYLAVVASLGALLRSPSLAVDLLLLGSVPLAALTAFALLRRVVASRWTRIWAAATYALLPATTGAIAAGRLGTAAAIVLTPLVALAAARLLGTRGRPGPYRAAWTTGLLLAVTTAFVPLAWVVAVVLGVVAVAAVYQNRAHAVRVLTALAVPPVVLAPWTAAVWRDPDLLVTEAGPPGPGLSDAALPPWAVLLQNPGGPGAGPALLGVGVLLAGWAALLRHDRPRVVSAGWAVALVALLAGVVVSRLPVAGPTLETPVAGWPGYAAALVGGGLIVAAAGGADGLREQLAGTSFGWRQPLAAVVVPIAVLAPVLSASWWVIRGAAEPIDRRDSSVLPAYVADAGGGPERVRTLVLGRADDGRVTYALQRESGPQLGDAETGPPPRDYVALDRVVSDLVSDRGGADASSLAPFAVRYVYLPAPADDALADILDTVPGLSRASAPQGAVVWEVAGLVARVRVTGGPVAVPSSGIAAAGSIPEGPNGRQLVLAEMKDPGWQATLDGEELRAALGEDWFQAFELNAGAGTVELDHANPVRTRWLVAQLVSVLLVVVLALPAIRRERDSVDDVADVDPDDPTSPGLPAVPVLVPAGNRQDTAAAAKSRTPYSGRRAAPRPTAAFRTHSGQPGGRRAKGRRASNGDGA